MGLLSVSAEVSSTTREVADGLQDGYLKAMMARRPSRVVFPPGSAYSLKNATDCNVLISKALRQRMLEQASFSSLLTM